MKQSKRRTKSRPARRKASPSKVKRTKVASVRRRGVKTPRPKAGGRKKAPGFIREMWAQTEGTMPPSQLAARIGTYYKPMKQPVTLRLDVDVVAWFKKLGRGYQTRINRVLRQVMMRGR